MRKIALDLDGVVFDSENLYRVYAEIHDVDVIKKDSLIDNKPRIFQNRYDWPEEEKKALYQNIVKEVLSTANLMTGVDIVLNKLKKHFELIIVTSRDEIETNYAKEKLAQIGLQDIPIFFNEKNKIGRLKEEKVDYIIDDEETTCKAAMKENIHAIYLKNAAADYIEESEYMKTVNNWGEIYKYLMLYQGGQNENRDERI